MKLHAGIEDTRQRAIDALRAEADSLVLPGDDASGHNALARPSTTSLALLQGNLVGIFREHSHRRGTLRSQVRLLLDAGLVLGLITLAASAYVSPLQWEDLPLMIWVTLFCFLLYWLAADLLLGFCFGERPLRVFGTILPRTLAGPLIAAGIAGFHLPMRLIPVLADGGSGIVRISFADVAFYLSNYPGLWAADQLESLRQEADERELSSREGFMRWLATGDVTTSVTNATALSSGGALLQVWAHGNIWLLEVAPDGTVLLDSPYTQRPALGSSVAPSTLHVLDSGTLVAFGHVRGAPALITLGPGDTQNTRPLPAPSRDLLSIFSSSPWVPIWLPNGDLIFAHTLLDRSGDAPSREDRPFWLQLDAATLSFSRRVPQHAISGDSGLSVPEMATGANAAGDLYLGFNDLGSNRGPLQSGVFRFRSGTGTPELLAVAEPYEYLRALDVRRDGSFAVLRERNLRDGSGSQTLLQRYDESGRLERELTVAGSGRGLAWLPDGGVLFLLGFSLERLTPSWERDVAFAERFARTAAHRSIRGYGDQPIFLSVSFDGSALVSLMSGSERPGELPLMWVAPDGTARAITFR